MDISCEPMEVDLSLNSIKSMDVSYTDSEDPVKSRSASPFINFLQTYIKQEEQEPIAELSSPVIENVDMLNGFQNVKKYHIIMNREKGEQSNTIALKLTVLIVLLISLIVYHVNTIHCSEEIDVQLIEATLEQKIFGQERAIKLLSTALDAKVSSKILFLLGGTGVGKTYATTLMFEKVWNSSNVYHYTMPTFLETFPNNLLVGMSFCESSILIVDDLTRQDMNIKEHVENVIAKSENLQKNITVILIYNTDSIERGFYKSSEAAFLELELRDHFIQLEAYKEFIKFEPLTEEHLELCIKVELGYSNVPNIKEIMKNFNVSLDGCKGVYMKMKFLNLL